MTDQRSANVEAGHFIAPAPDGPALLYMLWPHGMVVSDCRPPKMLTIMHQVPKMGPHVVSDGVRRQVHDSHVPCDKSHRRHGLILVWLPFMGVDVFMRPDYFMYSCSMGRSKFT